MISLFNNKNKITSINIANYFMKLSLESGGSISLMKLIKMTYIAHGWYLSVVGKELFIDEVQAWRYGPVIPKLYDKYKNYGSLNISEKFNSNKIQNLSYDIKEFLDAIWNNYSKFTGIELSIMCACENSPWYITWNKLGGKHEKGAVIFNDLIKLHYDYLRASRNKNNKQKK